MQEIKKAAVPQVTRASTAATAVVAVVEGSSLSWNFVADVWVVAGFDLAAPRAAAEPAAAPATVAAPATASARPGVAGAAGVADFASGRFPAGRAPDPGRLGLTVIRAVSFGGSLLSTDVPDFLPDSDGGGTGMAAAGFKGAGAGVSTGRATAPGDAGLMGVAGLGTAGVAPGGVGAAGFMGITGLMGLTAAAAVAGFAAGVPTEGGVGVEGIAGFTAVTGAAEVGGVAALDKAPVAMTAAALGRAWVRRGGTIADVLGLSCGGGTTGAGVAGGEIRGPDVGDSGSRGGGVTMLDCFFGSPATTGAVPEEVAAGVPGTTGAPGVTVAGRCGSAGRLSMRLVGGGGGGTVAVFFTSATGGGGTACTFSGGGGGTVTLVSGAAGEAERVGGVEIAAVLAGVAAGIGMVIAGIPPVVFFFSCGGCSGGATGGAGEPATWMLPVVFFAFSGTGGARGEGGGAIGAGPDWGGVTGAVGDFAAASSFGTTTGAGGFTIGTRIGADWATARGTGGATAWVTSSGWFTAGVAGKSTRRMELVGRFKGTAAVPPSGSGGRPGEDVTPVFVSIGVERGGCGASG